MPKPRTKTSLTLFISLFVVISLMLSSLPGIASPNPQAITALNDYLPIVLNRYPRLTPFGVTMFTIDDPGGLAKFTDGGTRWTRSGFYWSKAEPVEGERQWQWYAGIEQQVLNAASSYITPVMLIDGTPTWALKADFECGAVAQDKFPALANFAFDLVRRYSQPPFNVRYWELWNEPDAAGTLGCWGDPSDRDYYGGYYYGLMLQAVYPRIKEADPQAQVLVGGLLLDCNPDPNFPPTPPKDCTPSKFLQGILESGAGPSFDGVSFHAYDFNNGTGGYANVNWQSASDTTGPVLITKADFLKGLLQQYGFSQKYLMSTETAVFWGPNQTDPPCASDAPLDVELVKVHYVIHSYAAAIAEGLKTNIWYAALGGRCAALLNLDLSPKPAYHAYQFAQQQLGQALFVRQINEFPQLMGYVFQVDAKDLWVLWSLDGLPHTVSLPALPADVKRIGDDGFPVQETSAITLTIDSSPRFIGFFY